MTGHQNHPLVRSNTNTIVSILLFGFLLSFVNLFFFRLGEVDIRRTIMTALFGVFMFGALIPLYNRNRYWRYIIEDRAIFLYTIYIIVSAIYGFWRFRTIGALTTDVLFFLSIPALLIIKPYSFDVRKFDKVLIAGIWIGVLGVTTILAATPAALFDRSTFHYLGGPLLALMAGSPYLLLKNFRTVNFGFISGFVGALFNVVVYGVIGAFRGQLVLALLVLLLFLFILIVSRKTKFGIKMGVLILFAIALSGIAFLVFSRFQEQLNFLTFRIMNIFEGFWRTGDIMASDGRLVEMNYFLQTNPNWKFILGHGVGGLWWDFIGLYRAQEGGTGLAGARTMLHINWLHFLFKIGFVGFGLLLLILYRRWHLLRCFSLQYLPWIAYLIYYMAITTYYGHKSIVISSFIVLMPLLHPWMFQEGGANRMTPAFRQMRPNRIRS